MQKSNLLSLDKAIKKIKLSFNKISSEDIFLQNALGRCLSKPIVSNVDNPKYDVSAMDGYAINYNNYVKINKKVTKKLKVIGESSAGNPFPKKIENLETVRIFTGAKLPSGSDSIIIQEDINNSSNKNFVETTINIKKNQYVRKKGLDFKKNEILFNEGTIIKSRHIGSIAMTGQTWLTVSRKPVVSILSTGNEILRVGEQQKKDKIPNGNSLMLASMVKEFGGIPKILPVASDNELDIYNIGLLIVLGLLFTAIAHTLFISGMKTVKATTASVIASLEPVYGILFAFFLLQEVPSIKELIGGVIILVVCYFASVKQD